MVSPLHSFHATRDFLLDVGAGRIPGHSLVNKFGHNMNFNTTEQDVWGQGGKLTFLQSAETMSVISSDVINDISSGTGARVVTIEGLDGSFNVVTEDVTLLATAVTTTQTFIRVYRMFIKEVGDYGNTNAGAITATSSTTSSVQNNILAGEGQSGTTHYTIPAGVTAHLLNISITVDSRRATDFHLAVRDNADVVANPYSPTKQVRHWEGIDIIDQKLAAGHTLPEKTDIWFLGAMVAGSGEVNVSYDLLLVADNY